MTRNFLGTRLFGRRCSEQVAPASTAERWGNAQAFVQAAIIALAMGGMVFLVLVILIAPDQTYRMLSSLGLVVLAIACANVANMMLVRVSDAAKTFAGMKARKVLIKNVSGLHPLLANCLRLTVGTADENAQMLVALKASL